MLKFKQKGEHLHIYVNSETIELTAHLDVKEKFWQLCKRGNVQRSPRAKQLLLQALTCPEEVWVIGDTDWAGIMGGGAYSAFRNKSGYQHVFVWDPSTKLSFDASSRWTPQSDGKTAKFGGGQDRIALDEHVTILHELGHFDQFLNNRDWYMERVDKQRSGPANDVFVSCQGDIESDNLSRNEWPVCDELGHRKRQTYWDDNGEVRLLTELSKFGVRF